MQKKILSVIIAITISVNALIFSPVASYKANAADYAQSLRNSGFPESYISSLVALHQKYPNWIFKPFKTNLNWSTAVSGERSKHSKQLIEQYSGNDHSMYCSCSSCYKNGKYVIQEASNWVSASQKAVEYYMDPRNFLNEKGIFQFESTQYNGTQSQSGVEAILSGTWMHNSKITYYNTEGKSVTITRVDHNGKTYYPTYSRVIMESAQSSGMSAYYLASKIKQENGSTKATATAVKGTVSPFQGIYNYYNIGANTGAYDGLAWAAGYLKITNATATLYSSYDSKNKKGSGTTTTLKNGQYMTWISTVGNYYKVRLYAEGPYREGRTGYIKISDVRTTYVNGSYSPGWGRPWKTPENSIVSGARYISQNFKTQFTGYLQKFNVNKESNELYSHEYMANVAAAAAESTTTYTAYKNANILGITKTFSIPVFNNMPNESTQTDPYKTATHNNVTDLKVTDGTTQEIDISWSKVSGVDGYRVEILKNGSYVKYSATTSTSQKIKGLTNATAYTIRVRGYERISGGYNWSKNWTYITYATRPYTASNFRATGTNNSAIYLAWNKRSGVNGYQIYMYDEKSNAYKLYSTIDTPSTTTYKVSNLANNKKYWFKIRTYQKISGKTYYSYTSDKISATTKNNMVTITSATSSKTKRITVKWNKAYYSCSGYQIMWSTTSDFSKNWLTVNASGMNTLSKEITTSQSNKTYYVKARAYKTVNGKTTYCSWSSTKSVKVK